MKHVKFVIKEFTNPSGEVVFRVCGWLNGKRIRKNLPTSAEARAEVDALEIEAVQAETGIRRTVTRLTEDELHEAEAVIRRLVGKPHSLSFYVDFALANYREPVCQKNLAEAATEYVAAKKHEFEQDLISESYFVRLEREMDRISTRIPVATVAELTSARLVAYFEFGRASRKTYNNRRGTMSGFLKFALQRDWITENPLAKIPAHRIRRRRSGAQTLSVVSAKKLMEFVETNHPTAVPFFALCLFAGIRPCLRTGEILRLKPEHVKLNEGIDAKLDRFIAENPDLRVYYEQLSKEELIRKLMLGKMQRSEYANGRNAEIRAWVEEHPEIKERIEARIKNVPEQNRDRAFINAAKTEAMNQTVQRRNGNGIHA